MKNDSETTKGHNSFPLGVLAGWETRAGDLPAIQVLMATDRDIPPLSGVLGWVSLLFVQVMSFSLSVN